MRRLISERPRSIQLADAAELRTRIPALKEALKESSLFKSLLSD